VDRIALVEFLALALLINAVVVLFALRTGWRPRAQRRVSRRSAEFPDTGPTAAFPEAVVGPDDRLPDIPDGMHDAGAAARPVGVMDPDLPRSSGWPGPDQAVWAERIQVETLRCERYHRPAAIVAMRLDGPDPGAGDTDSSLDDWLRSISTKELHALGRGSDLVQADGHGQFRALLVETDEAGARSYVQRAFQLLVPQRGDRRRQVRLVAGWAGSWAQDDLNAADRLAQARMLGSLEGWIRSDATWRS